MTKLKGTLFDKLLLLPSDRGKKEGSSVARYSKYDGSPKCFKSKGCSRMGLGYLIGSELWCLVAVR